MTGDGLPDIAIGAPQADSAAHRLRLGLDHQRAHPADRRLHAVPDARRASAPGSSSTASRPRRATASTAPRPAISWAPRWRASATRTATASAISRSARPAHRRTAAPARARSSSSPASATPATRNLAVTPPLQTIDGPGAGAGLGASLAAGGQRVGDGSGDVLAGAPGEASAAGAAYLAGRRPRHDLRSRAGRVQDRAGGCGLDDRQRGRGRARARRRRRRCAGRRAAARTAAAPGSSSAAAGRPCCRRLPARRLRPPASGAAAPACTPPAAAAPADAARHAAVAPGHDPAAARPRPPRGRPPGTVDDHEAQDPGQADRQEKERRSCRSARLKKPKPKYHIVKGKRVKVKPKPCRPRPRRRRRRRSDDDAIGRRLGTLRTSAGVRARAPRTLGLAAAIVSFGVFSSSIGSGALPGGIRPALRRHDGDGSLASVAELGDVNGDGIGDYAVGMPSADPGGSTDCRHRLRLPRARRRAAADADCARARVGLVHDHRPRRRDARIRDRGRGHEPRRPQRHRHRRAHGRRPGKSGGGAVYVIFGSHTPVNIATPSLYADGRLTNDPANPAPPSPIGSRYDGIVQDSHTGFSLAALPET